MIRKTAFLVTGTVAGVVGVLSYNPPQLNSAIASAGNTPQPVSSQDTGSQNTGSQNTTSQIKNANSPAQPAPAKSSTSTSASSSTSQKSQTNSSASSSSNSQSQNNASSSTTTEQTSPTPTSTQNTKQSSSVSGTYKGETSQTRWGPVQVQVTLTNGKITDVKTLQYPNGDRRSMNISSQVIPWLQEETLQVQSANIQGISGATYTSMGFQNSLASALQKAGL